MTRYLNLNEVLEMHRILINRYGGTLGVKDLTVWNPRFIVHKPAIILTPLPKPPH